MPFTGLAWLRELPLAIDERLSLDGELRLLVSLEQELAAIDKLTATKAHQDVQIQLLMTLPGINFTGAVGILAACPRRRISETWRAENGACWRRKN